ncbi:MAG TPA: energy transducer TonB [Bacteroidales bacterium]|nr:energy transducer TonB [Bacteroidales bacterium]HPS16302.1 energy transducer TonB [Bacteroidales bacterium]
MKAIVVILVMTLLPLSVISQVDQKSSKIDTNFTVVTQQQPFYPGGDMELVMFFYKNIQYPEEAVEKNITGNIMLSFDVLPDSTITNIAVLSNIGYGLEEQVVKLVTPLKYAPGIQNGEKIKMNVILTVPVRAK